MSAAELPGWFTPNQRRGIPRQLDDGVRALLIDTHYGIKRSSGPVLTDLEREGTSKVLEVVRETLPRVGVDGRFGAVWAAARIRSDEPEALRLLVAALADREGVSYLRTTRGGTPVIHEPGADIAIGGSATLRSSSDDLVTICAAGITLHEALEAADALAGDGLVRVATCVGAPRGLPALPPAALA